MIVDEVAFGLERRNCFKASDGGGEIERV